MLKFFTFILILFTSCESPKKIDGKLVESYKRYLFIQKISEDSLISNQLSTYYLDSLNVNKLELALFISQFNKDIQFRKLVLTEMQNPLDTLFYRQMYDAMDELKEKESEKEKE